MAKKPRKILAKFLPEFLLVFGTFLVITSTSHRFLRARALSISEETVAQYLHPSDLKIDTPIYPTHITIPWFVDVPIDPQTFVAGEWTISPEHASYLTDSAQPTKPGNIIIYGHNKRSILGNIRALKGNEKITLTLSNSDSRIYQITQIKQVSPSETDALNQTEDEVLTLYTCSGFLDSQRFIVRAKPVLE